MTGARQIPRIGAATFAKVATWTCPRAARPPDGWSAGDAGGQRSGFSKSVFTTTVLVALGISTSCFAIEAFPGAEGYGRFSQGGRDGAIIQVTTLEDSGPGSLRACIDASGPRVCVFRVAGVIRFTSKRPIIRNPYLTIAGQTAPGGGILVTHDGGADGFTPIVVKNTHDVIIRHIRVRLDKMANERASNAAFLVENSRNVILDHVSGAWAQDENFSGHRQNDNVTISWSIFAEGIPKHDKCALLASDPSGPQRLSFIKNVCAHNGDRNPDINLPPKSCAEVANNVIYNAKSDFAEVWESHGGSWVNIVNNYFKSGPDTHPDRSAIVVQSVDSTGPARIYHEGNKYDGSIQLIAENARDNVVPSPVCPFASNIMSAAEAYTKVLAMAGAFPRDGVDNRVVNEIRNGTGQIKLLPDPLPMIADGIPYQDGDADGMSDLWEKKNGLDPAANDAWSDKDGDGWPNFDEFLDYAHNQLMNGRVVPSGVTTSGWAGWSPWWLVGLFALIALSTVFLRFRQRTVR